MTIASVRKEQVAWEDVPFAARIEAMRIVILRGSIARDKRLTNIYFIQEDDGGYVKVGRADSVDARLKGMQCGNPRTLRVIASAELPCRLEKEIHGMLAGWRVGRSEWFHASAEVLAAADAVAAYSVAGADNPLLRGIRLVEPKDANK